MRRTAPLPVATELPIGQAIRAVRRSAKMTQATLAERAAIHDNTVTQIESGYQMPSLPVADRIARSLGTDLWRLLRYTHDLGAARKPPQTQLAPTQPKEAAHGR